jgi:choline kinase
MNGDVLYPPQLLKQIIDSEYDTALAVDIKKCGDEEVKVIVDNKRIVSIGKELDIENSLGEFIGIAKLSIPFCNSFSLSLSKLIDNGGKSEYFESAIAPLLHKNDVYYEDITHLPCIEIDFNEDLQKANQLVKNKLYNI